MGYLIAAVFGLMLQPLLASKLPQGGFGFKTTFWLFGVAIGGIAYVVTFGYFIQSLHNPSYREDDIIGALSLGIFLLGYYSLFIFLGIWRASRGASLGLRWGARYVSFFFFSAVLGALMFATGYCVITAVMALIAKKLSGQRRSTAAH